MGKLLGEFPPHTGIGGGPADDDTGRGRDNQGRDLGDEAVADGQQRIGLQRLHQVHVLQQNPDTETAKDIDRHDDQRSDGLAADKFAGTIHGPVKLCLPRDLFAAALGFFLVDQAGVQIRVDGHLLARHGIQGETGGNLRDTARTFGDDDEIDKHHDQEDDQTDREIAAYHKIAKGLNDLPDRTGPLMTMQQDQPGGGNIEGQTVQGGDQQQGGEGRKIERIGIVHRHQQNNEPHGDAERQQQIEGDGRQRDDHHHQNGNDADRNHQA